MLQTIVRPFILTRWQRGRTMLSWGIGWTCTTTCLKVLKANVARLLRQENLKSTIWPLKGFQRNFGIEIVNIVLSSWRPWGPSKFVTVPFLVFNTCCGSIPKPSANHSGIPASKMDLVSTGDGPLYRCKACALDKSPMFPSPQFPKFLI